MPSAAKKAAGRTTPKKETEKPLQVTSLEDWDVVEAPKESGFICELPSGKVVRVIRNLDLGILLQGGMIPNPLANVIRKMMRDKDPNFPVDQIDNNDQMLRQLMELLHQNAASMIVEPKVSAPRRMGIDESGVRFAETQDQYEAYLNEWNPEPGTLSVFRIGVNDLMYLFAVGQGAAADLERFRSESNPIMAPLQPSEPFRDPPKRSARHK